MQREFCSRIGANVLIDDHAKHLNNTLFGEYPWQPCPDKRDSRIIGCSIWPAIKRTIAQIAQDEEV